MELQIRYIGDANKEWKIRKASPSKIDAKLSDPMLIIAGDLITTPDFPGRLLIVKMRQIDLTESIVILYLDLLPGHLPGSLPENVFPISG